MIKTLFIGTDEFGLPTLEALMNSELVDLVGVVTQPDRPAGRKQELQGSAIKEYWQANLASLVSLYQPEKLRLASNEILTETEPELIIVAAYGQMVPDMMLVQPKFKCLNVHASLLPQLRGAVPIPMAILNGLSETGVTIQQMVTELDAGPILGVQTTPISDEDTTVTLKQRLAVLGSELLLQILPDWTAGKVSPKLQDDSQATMCKQDDLTRSNAEIKFATDVHLAGRMVRAFNPEPIAWIEVDTNSGLKQIGIFSARVVEDQMLGSDKLQIVRQGKQLFLTLQNGMLEVLELQIAGKDRRLAAEYLSSFNYFN